MVVGMKQRVYIWNYLGVKKKWALALVEVGVRMLRLGQSLLVQLGNLAELMMTQWRSSRIEALDFARGKETFILEPVVFGMPTYLQVVGKLKEIGG